MNKEDCFLVEWNYTPKNYFEEEIKIETYGEIVFNEGSVKAYINPNDYDVDNHIKAALHKEIDAFFLGAQLINNKPYILSKPSHKRIYPDGRENAFISADKGIISLTSTNVDLIAYDKDGNIVSNPKQDRIKKRNELAKLAKELHLDFKVSALLRSYNLALNNPENELIYLFEIREALQIFFPFKKDLAIKSLGLNEKAWSRLGQLANDTPLRQGRHRGKKVQELKDATIDELEEARAIASNFIQSFMEHQDSLQ